MSRSELVRRYGIFTSGVIFAALGIALITRAGLGTSAVSGLPYVCSLIFPALSFGTFNFIFEILLFLAGRPAGPGIQPGPISSAARQLCLFLLH